MKTLLEYIDEHKIDIDRDVLIKILLMVNEEWIYFSKLYIHNWIGYKVGRNSHNNVVNDMKKKYIEGIDYKEVEKNHHLVLEYFKAHPDECIPSINKKFYIVSNKTFVVMLMRAKTTTSIRYAEYFYHIHDLMIKYYKYQAEFTKQEFKAIYQLQHVREYTQLQNIKYLELKSSRIGVVYFVHENGVLNKFKIGWTTDLPMRMKALQVSNWRDLMIYKTMFAESQLIEAAIHEELVDSAIRGEWFDISPPAIDDLIQRYSK